MCGIFGTTFNHNSLVLEKKISFLKHRGPDYYSIKKVNAITMAHTRLSILDLNPRSNQPFDYLHLTITFNGEIYNYLELKKSLIKKGYSFTTESDTEVLCALYLDKKENMLQLINGMFSFVIFDRNKNILFGARDRLGKKPFFYFWNQKEFEFSSSLYAIAYNNNLVINRKAIKYYLEWGYVQEPMAMFENTFKLCAGHAFNLNLNNKKEFKTWEYWDIPKTSNNYKLGFANAVNELDEIINKSVKKRLVADVPIGVFLSGGVDSSLIASVAQFQSHNKIKTFSVGFQESKYDESAFATNIAKFLGTNHTRITLSSSEGLEFITKMTEFYDEPLDDSSSIAQLLLSKVTKEYVTVALSGDGGDEFFIGYPQYQFAFNKKKIYDIPKYVRSFASNIIPNTSIQKYYLYKQALKLNTIEDLHTIYYTQLDRRWLNFDRVVLKNLESKYLYSDKPLLERLSDFDIKTYMNGDILTKVDRGSMAFSLEVRSPLLDFEVLNFAKTLPVEYKFRNGEKKIILREVLKKYLPNELYERPKQGFSIPISEWFRNDLKDYLNGALNDLQLQEIPEINSTFFNQILQDHFNNKWDNTSKIFRVLMLVQWINKVKEM